MRINDFLKQIASDIKTTDKDFTKEDFYYLLKYTGIKKDKSLVSEIEEFYDNFLESLNNSLIRHITRRTGSNENTTHYIGFYTDKRASYTESYKVYFPVKYEYMISALKTIFSYLIRNSIESVVKFHVKATNENIVIRFYHKEDVIPFINYCNNNFILDDLLEKVNPFIATIYGIGIVRDDNTLNTYNGTLSEVLEEYFKYLHTCDALDKISDLHFLDYVMQKENAEENEIIRFNLQAIEKNIKAILSRTSPLD